MTLDLAAAHVEEAIGDDGDDVFNASGMTSNAFLDGAGGNDILIGGIADDAITGNRGDDYIDGGAGNDVLRGGDGSDLIYGNEGDDIVYGEGGDDILVGGAVSGPNGANMLEGDEGDDLLIGTGGYSVASYRGSFAGYTVTQNTDGTFTVADSHADRDGTDTLKDISTLNFADITNVALDSSLPTYGLTLPANDRIDVASVGPYVISASDVLANDKNVTGRSLSIRQLLDVNGNPIARGASGAAVGGTVALSVDGATITFTPEAGFTGVMKFKYQVLDSEGQTGLYAQQVGTANVAEMAGTVFLDTPDHPTDEMFDAQWYLSEVNVLPVWEDYTGAGVSIAVFDPSGNVDLTHPDLAANAGNSFKINGSPGVEQYGMHATLVAGVIGAERNGEGVVGVAYDATISSVAIPTAFLDLDSDVDLTRWKDYDIVNNSWGLSPSFIDNFYTNPVYESAYISAVRDGRNGKGTILVFGAGNDRGTRNTNDVNETNSRYGITVAGVNAQNDPSTLTAAPEPFSTQGETILVSAPGSSIASTSEVLTSSTGTVFGSDYQTAQGTSFATPIVSGVVALMLEANPNLGYRDVQNILAYSARHVNDPSTSWQGNGAENINGGGLNYSRDYGFGEVDAHAAVRLAETWQNQETANNLISFNAASQTATVGHEPRLVLDYGPFWIPVGAHIEYDYTFPVSYVTLPSDVAVSVEHVQITVDLDMELYPINRLAITFEPLGQGTYSWTNNGTSYEAQSYSYFSNRESILLNGEQSTLGESSIYIGSDGHRHLRFAFGSEKYRGEDWHSGEKWALRTFIDGQEVIPPADWSITVFGASDAEPRQWIFTDEFNNDLGWISPISPYDSFNASAATGDNVIDLRPWSMESSINGHEVDVAGYLTKGFAGDGNDILYTNGEFDSLLDGGRGNDTLVESGRGTNDKLIGGQGVDTVTYASATDSGVVVDLRIGMAQNTLGGGVDTISGVENLIGSAFADTLIGDDGINIIDGEGGDDVLNGGVGPDTLSGGIGNDIYFTDNASDKVSEAAGEGTDYVFVSVNYELGAGQEVEYLVANAGSTGLTLIGNEANNFILGLAGADMLDGDAGNDTLNGGANNDILIGGSGDDVIDGSVGADTLSGGIGNDIYFVDDAADVVNEAAGEGADIAFISSNYTLGAGQQVEYLIANAGSRGLTLTGNELTNQILGLAGADKLNGGAGSDVLNGGAGDDVLNGEGGVDLLAGGVGNDAFLFSSLSDGLDVINDFTTGADSIWISAGGFGGGLVAGESARLTTVGDFAAANNAVPCFIYDNAGANAGTLYWDANGGSGADAIAFAALTGGPAVAATDIVITV